MTIQPSSNTDNLGFGGSGQRVFSFPDIFGTVSSGITSSDLVTPAILNLYAPAFDGAAVTDSISATTQTLSLWTSGGSWVTGIWQ